MACKEGQFDVVDQFKTFGINLNAQHVNGMTPFDLALSTVIRYSRVVFFPLVKLGGPAVVRILFLLQGGLLGFTTNGLLTCKETIEKIVIMNLK